jgi:hypothetical protein
MSLEYHRDKNGKEIKYVDVIHDSGIKLEVFGTGLKVPGDDGYICCYRPNEWKRGDNPLPVVFVKTSEVRIDTFTLPNFKSLWKIFGKNFWNWFLGKD